MSRIMLDRLIGLETEYATLVRSPLDQLEPPSRRSIYEAICAEITKQVPTARGRYDADSIFLANGGAFSMEGSPTRTELPGGLIEGATAETRSPACLVQCQRAQDQLIAEAATSCHIAGRVTIVKNSCDAHGHVYGCQENYSAPVASGGMLLVYWFAMLLVMVPAMVYWTACLSILAIEMGFLVFCRAFRRILTHLKLVQSPEVSPVASLIDPLPPFMLSATAMVLRVLSMPAAGMLYLVARHIAFRPQRDCLTAFLISRVVVTGAGHVDRCNRFRLSSKAMAIDTVTGFGGYLGERPIFVFHHWLQQLCGRSLLSTRSITEMFRVQQRLQIGLSDSNVSDTAEYLKVGTTSLVLDMIEAGFGKELPRLLSPIDALHRISSDWNLITRVRTNRGDMSGLDIQRAYFKACRNFVSSQQPPVDSEVFEVLRRWEHAIEALSAFRSTAVNARPGLGHIDWLTKKWMLDRIDEITPQLGVDQDVGATSPSARWTARKKVDIRYHELSEDSYFAKLRCLAPEVCSVDRIGVDHALRLPPAGSPALRRGQLIREFSGGALDVSVDWSHVVIGSGKDRRIVSVG